MTSAFVFKLSFLLSPKLVIILHLWFVISKNTARIGRISLTSTECLNAFCEKIEWPLCCWKDFAHSSLLHFYSSDNRSYGIKQVCLMLPLKCIHMEMNLLSSLQNLLQRLKNKRQKRPLHTQEELACFKNDAIQNHKKHYWLKLSNKTEGVSSKKEINYNQLVNDRPNSNEGYWKSYRILLTPKCRLQINLSLAIRAEPLLLSIRDINITATSRPRIKVDHNSAGQSNTQVSVGYKK